MTDNNSDSNLAAIENLLKVTTLERCFNEGIDREMGNMVDTVEDRIQNAILTAIDGSVTPEIELAIKSKNASSGQIATIVLANSECGGHKGTTSPFENLSERNNILHVVNANLES